LTTFGDANGLRKGLKGIIGPWPCDECKELSQFADVGLDINRIFCKNPSCGFRRLVDKKNNIIRENDGTFWSFDTDGVKTRVMAR
jgi:hypothetical protein